MTTKDLLSHFNLTQLPFSKEIPVAQLLELPSLQRAYSSLELLVETRGIGLLLGKSGTGKSSLLRKLCASLHGGLYKPLYLCHTSVSLNEFYTHLCAAFGLEPVFRRSKMFRMIQDRVLALNRSNRIHPILLVDESQYLSNSILQEIRLLTNFEIDSLNALTVLLCGREELAMQFDLSILEPLANSITLTVHLDGLSKEESFSYIEGRLRHCGNSTPVFTKNALELTHQASAGIMRDINAIAHGALMNAYLDGSPQVEAEHVKAAIER
jgi:type II secretory pathway predicted ATPase ExeA